MENDNRSRRTFLRTVAGTGAALAFSGPVRGEQIGPGPGAVGLRCKPLSTVRAAIIGVGDRGSGHVETMLSFEGLEIVAIADKHEPTLRRSLAKVTTAGRKEPAAYANGEYDYKRMLQRDDVDMVVIATPWELHTPMAVDTLLAGKHAFIEIPAAITVDECWQLVETAEKTQKHCMMLENCCYNREELFCLNLCRLGLLGKLLHAETAYIHDLRWQMKDVEIGTGSWRTLHYAKRNGNLYPTHGIGPVAQYMGINRGDRFDYLSAVASPALGRKAYASEHYPPDHKWNRIPSWAGGDINTTIIKTALGRSIMVQWDETSPRPYSRLNLIQGTRGTFAGYPPRLAIEGVTPDVHKWVEGKDLEEYFKKYEHPLWDPERAKKLGDHGTMDWLMHWRLITCLRSGEPLDQDVYDAAAWSSIGPLSERSIVNRSQSIDVPDFTRGRWKTTKPLGIVANK
jgi:predicted dehydrogenase